MTSFYAVEYLLTSWRLKIKGGNYSFWEKKILHRAIKTSREMSEMEIFIERPSNTSWKALRWLRKSIWHNICQKIKPIKISYEKLSSASRFQQSELCELRCKFWSTNENQVLELCRACHEHCYQFSRYFSLDRQDLAFSCSLLCYLSCSFLSAARGKNCIICYLFMAMFWFNHYFGDIRASINMKCDVCFCWKVAVHWQKGMHMVHMSNWNMMATW
jgi:hypothetical protein